MEVNANRDADDEARMTSENEERRNYEPQLKKTDQKYAYAPSR
jgi:hypothetical protein